MGKLSKLFDKALEFTDKNSPAILTGLACAGIVATAIAAYKAGPKVKEIMDLHKQSMGDLDNAVAAGTYDEEEAKEKKKEVMQETVKEVVPALLPPVLLGGVSMACAIGSNKVSTRRIAALSAAYEIASRSLSDYKEQIKEIVPKKADEIKDAVVKKHVQKEEVPDEKYVYSTGRGDVLCKDIYTNVYFRSSHAEIEKAINKLSADVRSEGWVTVNDLYYELGVKDMPPITNDIGWHDNDCIEGNLPIQITTCWDKSGTIPVIGLDYEVDPFFKEGGRFRR